MPVALTEEVRARIVDLRHQGLSANVIAQQLGIARSTVFKHSEALPPDRVAAPPKRGRGRPPGRKHYWDDPRFPPNLDVDEYADVVPIRFFPRDLPRLTTDRFGWTQAELDSACRHARKKLFPLTRQGSRVARRGAKTPAD